MINYNRFSIQTHMWKVSGWKWSLCVNPIDRMGLLGICIFLMQTLEGVESRTNIFRRSDISNIQAHVNFSTIKQSKRDSFVINKETHLHVWAIIGWANWLIIDWWCE